MFAPITFLNPSRNLIVFLISAFLVFSAETIIAFGSGGLFPQAFEAHTALRVAITLILAAHITITCMSISFHRYHTHKGVILNPLVDSIMQIWLWLTTSMSKLDWVSVHAYHHAYSDQPEDAHSPVQSGFWSIFFLGAYKYTVAKEKEEVLKIRRRLKENKLEKFISANLYLGPILLVTSLTVLFGPVMALILAIGTFLISPLFAVGGVNALAHWWGYRHYNTTDNSRNIGFLFPLNWVISGELDHNNHHAHPTSCRFSHRWYEFDVGYLYIRILSTLGLAEIKSEFKRQK